MGGAPSLSQQGFTTRPATKDDLDDLTRIHIEGFTEEPQIHYRYPFRHQYPEDHWKWTRKEYENYLEQPQKYVVYVAEALRYVHGSIAVNPIGHAVWNVAVLTEAAKGGKLNVSSILQPLASLICPYQILPNWKEGMRTKNDAMHSSAELANASKHTLQNGARSKSICLPLWFIRTSDCAELAQS